MGYGRLKNKGYGSLVSEVSARKRETMMGPRESREIETGKYEIGIVIRKLETGNGR